MPITNWKIVHTLPGDFKGTFGVGSHPTLGKTTLQPSRGIIQSHLKKETVKENITPTMTASNAPAPWVVTQSTFYQAGYEGWRLFDGINGGNGWATATGVTSGWIKLDAGAISNIVVDKYVIYPRSTLLARAPKTWQFKASNDDLNWVVLDSRANVVWTDDGSKEFSFPNEQRYRYYLWEFSANGGDPSYIHFNEMEIHGAKQELQASFYGVYDSQPINLRELNAVGLSNFSIGATGRTTQKAVIFTRTANASGAFSEKWEGSATDGSMANFIPAAPPTVVQFSPPLMTSNTTPAPYVLEVQGPENLAAWNAFDGSNATYFYLYETKDASLTGNLAIDMGTPRIVDSYLMLPHISDRNYGATDWSFEGSHDKADWAILDDKTNALPGASAIFPVTNSTAYRYYRWSFKKANSEHGIGYATLNLFWNEYTPNLRFSASGLDAEIDQTTVAVSSGGSLKISGFSEANGAYVSLRLNTATVPLSDVLQFMAKCDNPSTSFRLKLHTTSSVTPLAPTAASHWSYEFKMDSENFKDFYFPDFIRSTAMTTAGTYWLTLQVINAAGGFNLWLDDVRFRKGLGNGDAIQSLYRPWLQYRTVLMTTN